MIFKNNNFNNLHFNLIRYYATIKPNIKMEPGGDGGDDEDPYRNEWRNDKEKIGEGEFNLEDYLNNLLNMQKAIRKRRENIKNQITEQYYFNDIIKEGNKEIIVNINKKNQDILKEINDNEEQIQSEVTKIITEISNISKENNEESNNIILKLQENVLKIQNEINEQRELLNVLRDQIKEQQEHLNTLMAESRELLNRDIISINENTKNTIDNIVNNSNNNIFQSLVNKIASIISILSPNNIFWLLAGLVTLGFGLYMITRITNRSSSSAPTIMINYPQEPPRALIELPMQQHTQNNDNKNETNSIKKEYKTTKTLVTQLFHLINEWLKAFYEKQLDKLEKYKKK